MAEKDWKLIIYTTHQKTNTFSFIVNLDVLGDLVVKLKKGEWFDINSSGTNYSFNPAQIVHYSYFMLLDDD